MIRRFLTSFLLLLSAGGVLGAQSSRYFWDDPEFLVRQGGRYPVAVDNGTTAAAFWQERRTTTEGWPQSYLSVTVRQAGDTGWTTRHGVLGPFTIVGAEAQFYSAVLTKAGVFWVAVLGEGGQLVLYRSDDGAKSFEEEGRLTGTGSLLVPKLFLGAGDEPILTVNQADTQSFRLFASRHRASGWTPLQPLTPEEDQRQSFSPAVAVNGGELVLVYQSQLAAQVNGLSRITFQLYRKTSADGGQTWSAPVRLTTFADDLADNPDAADNQRPAVFVHEGQVFVAWERRTNQTNAVLEVAGLAATGKLTSPQALTSPAYMARNPLFYTFRGNLHLVWFDNRNDTYDVIESVYDPDPEVGWSAAEPLSKETGNSVFGQPAKLGNDLYFFWQNNFGENPGVVMLQPDRKALPPTLRAVNFKPEGKTRNGTFTVEVVYPKDISGIRAFNALLTRDPAAEPDHDRRILSKDRLWTETVSQEGLWYLAVAVLDNAGNWSAAARTTLQLKLTPPGPVAIAEPPTDSAGYLVSNTFDLTWRPTTDDAAAYSWRLSRLGGEFTQPLLASLKDPVPPSSPTGTGTTASGRNLDDGLWALSVSAFDEAGNQGPVSTRLLRLNKFQPYTLLTSVETSQDPFGRIQLVIRGRGFADGGPMDRVYIDKDGREPWDYELKPGQFTIAGDRLISGIKLEGLAEGVYRVGVGHPVRGRVFSGPVLQVEPAGTVKIGDFRNLDQTVWTFVQGVSLFFSVHAVYFWTIMAFLALVVWGSGRLLARVWADSLQIARETRRWFADTPDKWGRRAQRTAMKAQRISLAVKFAAAILSLTGAIILMLSITLGFFITENSQRSLGAALQQRAQVLLESLATGARTYMPTQNINELANLPQQISAMPGEAIYATITGPSAEKKTGLSYYYASNDPDIAGKLDTPGSRIPGVSVVKDDLEPAWAELQADLNQKAAAAVQDLVNQVEALTKQARPLVEKTDAASRAELTKLEDQNSQLKRQIINKLAEVGGQARSLPAFNPANLLANPDKKYLLYQPFLYLTVGDPTYVRGLIRLEISAEQIEKQILATRDQLVQVTVLIALVALVLGLVGAFLLSALIIRPIRKLVAGVQTIRDTEDKTKLEGHVIEIGTRDEIDDLALSVNQMTRGLVDGANRTVDLTKGKIEQKTLFIPLDKDPETGKKTTYHQDLEDIEVFAYYEGAKLVSGDLYEFRHLDSVEHTFAKDTVHEGRMYPKGQIFPGAATPEQIHQLGLLARPRPSPWYGLMKGDVSGKGVEAGMVMAIAAMFVTTFFRNWREKAHGKSTRIAPLLLQVNDTLEPILAEAGRGLFVALNVGVLNAKTGQLRFAQAGDNLLHIWHSDTSTFETLDLSKTISVGAMPSLEHPVPYRDQDLRLNSGDVLLYFTDGIEESQTAFRGPQWESVAYFNPDDPTTVAEPDAIRQIPAFPGGPMRDAKAVNTEDFNPHRIEAVISAYFARGRYELKKQNWLHPDHTFTFDFAGCDGSAAQLVTALISVDRVFRLVPDPKATDDDHIDLDLVQDEFLKKHFVEYGRYFRGGYVTYEKGEPGRGEILDREGYQLKGTRRTEVWQKAGAGESADPEGFLLDAYGDRVPQFRKGDPKKESTDPEGYALVNGRRVPLYVRGNPKTDIVDEEGNKLEGGHRILSNPGYIRYDRLMEDHQFDDLTLLAIRKK